MNYKKFAFYALLALGAAISMRMHAVPNRGKTRGYKGQQSHEVTRTQNMKSCNSECKRPKGCNTDCLTSKKCNRRCKEQSDDGVDKRKKKIKQASYGCGCGK